MSCNVCVEEYNKSSRLEVKCDYCCYSVCRKCCETYLLSNPEKAHCMNCKKEWNLKILVNKFTRKFVDKDYKQHRERCLLERERALLPATQPLVEETKRKKEIKLEMYKIKEEIHRLTQQYGVLERNLLSSSKVEKTNRVFIRHCPNNTCSGFLSSQWKCGLCELWACADCHEIKGETRDALHTCKPENVETAKMMEKDTKPCPSCASPIFKINGCDQIWCTQCHTAFSWATGRVETTIHNPHYYEWLKRSGREERNPLEVQCGREIDMHFINSLMRLKCDGDALDFCRTLMHTRIVELPRYLVNRVRDNENLRVRFMLKEITETSFKRLLQKRDKETNKKQEIANVLGMYVNSATDIMYRYINELKENKHNNFREYLRELISLMDYANECLASISDVYKSKKLKI